MFFRIVSALFVALLVSQAGVCQQVDTPQFEAVSVKVSRPVGFAFTTMQGGPGNGDPGRIHYANIVLGNVITMAFDVSYWRISKPGWLEQVRFDIEATMPPDTTKE